MCASKDKGRHVHSSIPNIQKWRQSKCPWLLVQISKLYIQTMEHYTARQKSNLQLFPTTELNLKKQCWAHTGKKFIFIWAAWKRKTIKYLLARPMVSSWGPQPLAPASPVFIWHIPWNCTHLTSLFCYSKQVCLAWVWSAQPVLLWVSKF